MLTSSLPAPGFLVFEFWMAIGVAVTGWWFFTGLILWSVHLPKPLHSRVFGLATLIFLMALAITPSVSALQSVTGTVMSFTLAIVLWGWLELGYLMNIIAGMHKEPCPANVDLAERFRRGLGTCIYHELGVVLTGALIFVLADGGGMSVMFWTYATLWAMRWSAKLNLVLGVRNYNRDWLPDDLQYIDSYIQRRSMNPLFPLSLGVATFVAAWVFYLSLGASAIGTQIGLTLVATLLALGALEHVFLMLPLREGRLWGWAAPEEHCEASLATTTAPGVVVAGKPR
jgi:putative photosynthetic complex assembly protein 2